MESSSSSSIFFDLELQNWRKKRSNYAELSTVELDVWKITKSIFSPHKLITLLMWFQNCDNLDRICMCILHIYSCTKYTYISVYHPSFHPSIHFSFPFFLFPQNCRNVTLSLVSSVHPSCPIYVRSTFKFLPIYIYVFWSNCIPSFVFATILCVCSLYTLEIPAVTLLVCFTSDVHKRIVCYKLYFISIFVPYILFSGERC
jgi:hypothetical protein